MICWSHRDFEPGQVITKADCKGKESVVMIVDNFYDQPVIVVRKATLEEYIEYVERELNDVATYELGAKFYEIRTD